MSMKSLAYLTIAGLALILAPRPARAQGCIVARSAVQPIGPESGGGYMEPGEFDFTFGYRHQYSFRHFVGDVEQKQRIQIGNQVMNKVNLENFNLSYQLTPRFSVSGSLPLLLASRRSNNSPFTTTAQGIGDAIISVQAWIWNPRNKTRGNVSIGLGLAMPTGRDNLINNVDRFDGKGAQPTVLDYSIQPGSGGWGIVLNWQAFRALGNSAAAYISGNYIATPQNTTKVLRNTTTAINPLTLTAYSSISDQYLVQAGIAKPIKKVRGLTVTFGPRWEGVPAKDVIGDSLGFRRPGYAVSLEPGFQYARSKMMFTASVGKAILRDRTRSMPDRITGGHGDAAFADYVWVASYSYRFGTPRGMEH
jgi:hypothetical protein